MRFSKFEVLKNFYLKFFGVLFFVLGIIALGWTIWNKNYIGIFWLCYSALLLIGFGLYFNNGKLILTQLNILLIPDVIWTLDFVSYAFFSYDLFGAASYFFQNDFTIFSKILSLQHLFLMPVALIGLYFVKIDKNEKHTWFLSWIQTALIFGLSYVFSIFWEKTVNVNCAFYPCVKYLGTNFYPYTLIIIFACMVLFTDLTLRSFKVFEK